MPFFLNMLVGLVFQIIGFLILGNQRQKQELPNESDLEEPASQSRPIAKVFGSVTIESPQTIGAYDKQMIKRRMKGGKK